jgi:hypothetical protein|tara:strand:+ start:840 stop:1076 length:237 start_codon:yes stop_codon:yes gene_type:complete
MRDKVADILDEIHPVIEKAIEKTGASHWEVATALIVELSGLSVASRLEKDVLVGLLSFLITTIDTRPAEEQDASSTIH